MNLQEKIIAKQILTPPKPPKSPKKYINKITTLKGRFIQIELNDELPKNYVIKIYSKSNTKGTTAVGKDKTYTSGTTPLKAGRYTVKVLEEGQNEPNEEEAIKINDTEDNESITSDTKIESITINYTPYEENTTPTVSFSNKRLESK